MNTACEGGLCVYILCNCKTIKPLDCQLAPKHVLYLCYTPAVTRVMHKYMVKKCCTYFAIFVFWSVISEGKFVAHTACKLLQWLKFIEKRYFMKFRVFISNF